MHRDSGVLDPTGGAGVLAPTPIVHRPFLRSPVSSTTNTASASRRWKVTWFRRSSWTPVGGVPACPGQQVLRAMRVRVISVPGDRPAGLAGHVGRQPEQDPWTHRSRRRVFTRANRPAIVASSLSVPASQWAGPYRDQVLRDSPSGGGVFKSRV
ncbi:hypothetical protein SCATT_01330 [Streptantibioticus cattleyicolor NRRL 8057 = DSM 46488]|uniref:Uncharacterized protein n=1 Tax=Streptantibioticus cattleyicolor (strain ATCC 35852 / DSM 46488 / JCM 4925 / NBRC 14057 / NRRL 8057) TaxID=1003195 RepID=G8X1H5_STREN|nr:hypothetical protein SCATT_01330 [Streptantibioticus cattleyicolor NRRL 8057 = DSM 46488]